MLFNRSHGFLDKTYKGISQVMEILPPVPLEIHFLSIRTRYFHKLYIDTRK